MCSASIFEKSRMSLSTVRSDSPLLRSVLAKSYCSPSRPLSSSTSAMPITPFSGVRISWLMFARNSPFARSAERASASARRSSDVCRSMTSSCSSRIRRTWSCFAPASRASNPRTMGAVMMIHCTGWLLTTCHMLSEVTDPAVSAAPKGIATRGKKSPPTMPRIVYCRSSRPLFMQKSSAGNGPTLSED